MLIKFYKLCFSFLLCSLLSFGAANAQVILKRQVLSSMGASNTSASLYSPATFGQCPGCSTIGNTNVVLRQGFQQPTGTNDPNCAFASFDLVQINGGVCGDQYNVSFTGSANSDAVFTWDFGPNGAPATASGMDVDGIIFSSSGLQTLVLNVTQNGCTQTVSKVINVTNPSIAANLTSTPVKCKGGSDGSLSLNVIGGQAPYNYAWQNGITDPSSVAAGSYSITVTDAQGCTAVGVSIVAEPDSALSFEVITIQESCKGQFDGSALAVPSGGTAPYFFVWSSGGDTKEEEIGLGAGAYSVTVTDANNCEAQMTFQIDRYCESAADSVITIFTPGNGDGINDIWIIPGIDDYPNNEVIVYSRWGQKVWSKNGYTNADGWTGVDSENNDLPTSAYYYIIFLNDSAGTKFSGSITIIR
jgi:gliding motility-associated-like protein